MKNNNLFAENKRGQAAMEFLMTYGWAILAAIIVIAVLAIYFRPSSLTSTQVIVTAPFYGVGTTLSATQVQVEIRNNGGETLTPAATGSTGLTFTQPVGASCTNEDWEGSTGLLAGLTRVIIFSGCNLASGNTVNANVVIQYTRPDSSLVLTSTGTVSGTIP